MSTTWMPGYALVFTIDAVDHSITADQFSFEDGPAILRKPVFGSAHAQASAGQASGTFSAHGFCTTEKVPTLQALRTAAGAEVELVVTYSALGAVDTADVVIGRVSITARADGDVEWNITGEVAAAPVAT